MPASKDPIIDAQVHCYERDHPGRPWAAVLHGPPEVTARDMVVAMDCVGVDGGLLVSPYTMYRYDPSYAIECYNAYPGRFALIKPVDPTDPGVGKTIADWKKQKGTVAIRIMMTRGVTTDPTDPGVNRVLAEAAKNDFPVNLLCNDRLPMIDELAKRNPDTTLVIDHIGLQQPFEPPAPADGWANVPQLNALAKNKNVVVKITGGCTLSREKFPYKDIWEPIGRIFDAFGIERCMWGTDWTRAVGLLNYAEGVLSFRLNERLSDSDRAKLMGGNVTRIYKWAPSKG